MNILCSFSSSSSYYSVCSPSPFSLIFAFSPPLITHTTLRLACSTSAVVFKQRYSSQGTWPPRSISLLLLQAFVTFSIIFLISRSINSITDITNSKLGVALPSVVIIHQSIFLILSFSIKSFSILTRFFCCFFTTTSVSCLCVRAVRACGSSSINYHNDDPNEARQTQRLKCVDNFLFIGPGRWKWSTTYTIQTEYYYRDCFFCYSVA